MNGQRHELPSILRYRDVPTAILLAKPNVPFQVYVNKWLPDKYSTEIGYVDWSAPFGVFGIIVLLVWIRYLVDDIVLSITEYLCTRQFFR
jgi:hypothetical protein